MKEKELEKILKALANARRLAILKCIKKEKYASVGEIASTIKLSFKSTSKHLLILSNSKIVDREQEGLVMHYFIPKRTHLLVTKLLSII